MRGPEEAGAAVCGRGARGRVVSALLVIAASAAALGFPGSTLTAQTWADARESAWNLGPVVSVGEAYPDYLADDICGSDRSLALGGALDWVPSEAARWFGLEAEALFVTSWTDGLCLDGIPPDSVMDVDTELSTVFVALNGRAVAEIPVELGRLRLHGGGGLLLSGARPAVTWGGGWVARSGDFTASIILDWWTVWPGGDRVIEERTPQGFRTRTPIGPFDDSFDLRFLRFSVGWDVASPWDG